MASFIHCKNVLITSTHFWLPELHRTIDDLQLRCPNWVKVTQSFLQCTTEFISHHTHTFDKYNALCRHDVQLTQASVKVNIKASKTDPFHGGHVLHIAATATSTCPASALTKYFATSHLAQKGRPLFTFADCSYFTHQSLTEHLRTLLTSEGHDATAFASHSSGLVQLPLRPRQAFQTGSSKHLVAGLVAATRHTHSAAHHCFSIQAARSTPVLPYRPCDSNRQFHYITQRGDGWNPRHNFVEKIGRIQLGIAT